MLSIKFEDGKLIQNVPWLSLPNKPIKRITYLFNGKKYILEDYEEYNHLVEKTFNLTNGQTQIRNIYLMGRENGISHIIKLNKIDNSVIEYNTEYDEEYCAVRTVLEELWINGRPSTGWKKGI